MTTTRVDVAVIGGGITGLSAAWQLQQDSSALSFALLEATTRWGGLVTTRTIPGPDGAPFIVDGGPESFITRKPEAWALAQELGLADQIIDTGNETRNMYVLDQGKPVGVPLAPLAFLQSPLLSWGGKLRLLAEPLIPVRRGEADESLAEFADRRLGREAREKLIGPILAGIYNTDPESQSLLTTSPVMREMELEHGGLFRGALARLAARKRSRSNGGSGERPSRPQFFSFREGAGVLVDSLVHGLRGDLRLGTRAVWMERHGSLYRIHTADGDILEAASVILTVPAHAAAQLLREVAPPAAAGLDQIRYGSIGTISLAYREDDFRSGLRFSGLMIPRREGRAIDAVVWTSAKLPGRAPAGHTLIRVFFGGAAPETVQMPEAELVDRVREELRQLVGIQGQPLAHSAFRWPRAFPRADVGHLDRLDAIEASLPPGLALAGNAYRGIGVPDCIRQGRQAARSVIPENSPVTAGPDPAKAP